MWIYFVNLSSSIPSVCEGAENNWFRPLEKREEDNH